MEQIVDTTENLLNTLGNSVRWQIFIEGLTAKTRVGIHPHEHAGPQPIELDMELTYHARSGNDAEGSIINYDAYCCTVTEFLTRKPHTRLLETLAAEIAALSFRTHAALDEIRISIHKPKIRENVLRVGVASSWTRWNYETRLAAPEQENL